VPSILNFASSPTKIPLDVHATTGYTQGCLLECPSGITASMKDPTKIPLDTAIASMGSVVSSAAGSGKRYRYPDISLWTFSPDFSPRMNSSI